MRPKHLRPSILKYLFVIDNKHRWVGFVLTIIALAIVLYLRDYIDLPVSITFIFLVYSIYNGGLWWGLASAAVIMAAEVFLLFPVGQYGRFIAISLTLLSTVYLVAVLQRKAITCESVNGNIADLLKIMVDLQDVLDDWDRLTRDEIRRRIMLTTNGIVTLTTKVKGWHDIRQEMEEVNRTFGNDQ